MSTVKKRTASALAAVALTAGMILAPSAAMTATAANPVYKISVGSATAIGAKNGCLDYQQSKIRSGYRIVKSCYSSGSTGKRPYVKYWWAFTYTRYELPPGAQ